MNPSERETDSAAKLLIEELIPLLEELDAGDRSLDEQCARHPEHAEALRRCAALLVELDLDCEAAAIRTTAELGDRQKVQASSGSITERLQRLQRRQPLDGDRFQVAGLVARGGMGEIRRVSDGDLRRELAMKVVAPSRDPREGSDSGASVPPDVLERFLDEAQVTGQLDHPGIVPVHDLGLDADGRAYFTMRLVRGRRVDEVFALARENEHGWSITRALEVVLKICDTVAFAHSKGVIHRDLKPANVMVGRFGEVYVMDWGLAKVMGEQDRRDLRLRSPDTSDVSRIRARDRDEEGHPDSPLITMDGDVVGTPCYMPPEQAEGDIAALGPRSDVYAVGAMLYQLLTGWQPYVKPGVRISPRVVLRNVIEGAPKPVHEIDRSAPVELVAICERAMSRNPADRYGDMPELAADVRAFLDRRVVAAYQTGALAETKAWLRRNRSLAGSLAALLLVALISTLVMASLTNELFAKVREYDQLESLTKSYSLIRDAIAEESGLYPAVASKIPALERWLANLERELDPLATEIEQQFAPVASASGALPLAYEAPQQFRLRTLTEMRGRIERFNRDVRAGVLRRLAWARNLQRLKAHPNAAASWQQACAAIAAADGVVASTLYRGMPPIAPRPGFVPIGMNPVTGLWEFYDLRSAVTADASIDEVLAVEIPRHDETTGRIAVGEATGMVFVLVPAGTFTMGAERKKLGAPGFYADAGEREGHRHSVRLDGFYVSRYEMTQGQWVRLSGGQNPSGERAGVTHPDTGTPTLANPVERVRWTQCRDLLFRHGMLLPTESQWEYVCRAGEDSPFYCGHDPMSLEGHANISDRDRHGYFGTTDFIDGFKVQAPVGSFGHNAFGLHDVHGNVWEWCRDTQTDYELVDPRAGDGLRTGGNERKRVVRGGSFRYAGVWASCTNRPEEPIDTQATDIGVRPVVPLQ